MITAHLPSGYILGRTVPVAPLVLPAAVLGGVFPDFDMIWFYLIDDRAIHHHRYWVHIPTFWVPIALLSLPLVTILARRFLPAACVFFAAIFLHICLDTLVGGILWQWPWSNELISLTDVPARWDNWVLNFILHWTFGFELLIWTLALWLWKHPK